jgi:2'-5' RNA ligase
VRAFVAVFPPPEVRETLAGAARELPVAGEVRWIRPENLHLTMKFLGEVPEDELLHIAEVLDPLRSRHEPFEARLSGFGGFPSARRARVVWAGIDTGTKPLRALALDVEASLEPLGFERENRAYVPHLTLGRARGRPVTLEEVETTSGIAGFRVRSVELVQSVIGCGGAAYTTLATYPLSEGRDQGPD